MGSNIKLNNNDFRWMDGLMDEKKFCSTEVKIIIKVWNNMRLNDRFFFFVGTFSLRHLIEKPRKVKGE